MWEDQGHVNGLFGRGGFPGLEALGVRARGIGSRSCHCAGISVRIRVKVSVRREEGFRLGVCHEG